MRRDMGSNRVRVLAFDAVGMIDSAAAMSIMRAPDAEHSKTAQVREDDMHVTNLFLLQIDYG